MKCPECVELGQTSRVQVGGGATTDMYFAPFYDEEGVYHHHDGNATSWSGRCSNGHEFGWSTHPRCPAGDYPDSKP